MNKPDISTMGSKHYQVSSVQPWHLTRGMKSSGSAHVDGRRCNIIRYAFRMKGTGENELPKLIDDLKKAAHCALEAVEVLERIQADKNQTILEFCESVVSSNATALEQLTVSGLHKDEVFDIEPTAEEMAKATIDFEEGFNIDPCH